MSVPLKRLDESEGSGPKYAEILRRVNIADLFRIKGVGEEFVDLLEAAGADTVVEPGPRVPANLRKKMQEVNEAKKPVRRVPLVNEVEAWVKQARELPRVVTC